MWLLDLQVMRNCDHLVKTFTVEQFSNVRRHCLQTIGFQFGGLVCTTGAEKVWGYDAVAAPSKVFDLVDPTVRSLWEAVKEQEVWLSLFGWGIDGVAVSRSGNRKLDVLHHAHVAGVCNVRLMQISISVLFEEAWFWKAYGIKTHVELTCRILIGCEHFSSNNAVL